MELLFLIAVGFAFRSAFDHAKTRMRESRAASVRQVRKTYRKGEIPKHKLKAAARRHDAGWWLSEFGHGFPVARRGWQAGWIAHRTAAEQHRARLEEAKTSHAEAQASVIAGLPDHKARQAEARKRRDEILERLKGQPEEAKGSRKAVQAAADQVTADEVAVKRAEKQKAAGVPPLPSDTIDRKPAPGPYAPDDDADNADPEVETATSDLPEDHELSDWLRPGEPRCRVCDGRGCRDCRGWGSAAPDPNAPEAEPGTICNACGRPGTDDDPVLAQPGGTNLHRSHAEADPRNQADQKPTANPSPTTGGSPVTAIEATFTSVIAASRAALAQSDQDTQEIRGRKEAAYALADQMAEAGVDPAAISAQMDYADQLAIAEKALAAAGENAGNTATTVEKFHGQMQEAADNSPGKIAERAFHEGS